MNPMFTFSDGSFTHVKLVARAFAVKAGGPVSPQLIYVEPDGHSASINHESLESANSELEALRAAVLDWHRSKVSPLIPMPDGSAIDVRHVLRFHCRFEFLYITYTKDASIQDVAAIQCESIEDAEAERDGAIKLWAEYLESQP